MPQPNVRCNKCDEQVLLFEEMRDELQGFEVVWRHRQIAFTEKRVSEKPTAIFAVCECGYRWRLRCVSSLDEFMKYYGVEIEKSSNNGRG